MKTPKQKTDVKKLERLGNDLLGHSPIYARTLLGTMTQEESRFGNFILSEQRQLNLQEKFSGKELAKKLRTVQKEDIELYNTLF